MSHFCHPILYHQHIVHTTRALPQPDDILAHPETYLTATHGDPEPFRVTHQPEVVSAAKHLEQIGMCGFHAGLKVQHVAGEMFKFLPDDGCMVCRVH